jgi:Mg2+ and Co2+ transporter CorA
MNRRPSSKAFQEIYETLIREEIQQNRHMHTFTIVALSTPILATMAGFYFMNGGQLAGAYIAAIGTCTTSVCIPLANVSSRNSSRRSEKLKKDLVTLMEKP